MISKFLKFEWFLISTVRKILFSVKCKLKVTYKKFEVYSGIGMIFIFLFYVLKERFIEFAIGRLS